MFIIVGLNIVRRKCKHCPVPDYQVHEFSELERKYWLQLAKLQTTKMVRVYEKEGEPRTIFYKWCM